MNFYAKILKIQYARTHETRTRAHTLAAQECAEHADIFLTR